MRVGDKKGLTMLDSIKKNHNLPIIREMASDLLKRKATDYEESYKNLNNEAMDSIYLPSKVFQDTFAMKSSDANRIIDDLIILINSSDNLDQICVAIKAFKYYTSTKFTMFDLQNINDWTKTLHSSQKSIIDQKFHSKKVYVQEWIRFPALPKYF